MFFDQRLISPSAGNCSATRQQKKKENLADKLRIKDRGSVLCEDPNLRQLVVTVHVLFLGTVCSSTTSRCHPESNETKSKVKENTSLCTSAHPYTSRHLSTWEDLGSTQKTASKSQRASYSTLQRALQKAPMKPPLGLQHIRSWLAPTSHYSNLSITRIVPCILLLDQNDTS